MFLVGAGDFSPPNGYVFGTEVPCSEGFEPPPQMTLADKEGGRLPNGVDNAVTCENFGTHVITA